MGTRLEVIKAFQTGFTADGERVFMFERRKHDSDFANIFHMHFPKRFSLYYVSAV